MVHILYDYAADGHGGSALQSDAQKAAAAYKSVPALFPQEFEQGQKLRVLLYLVDENQSLVIAAQLIADHHAQAEVEILGGVHIFENLCTLIVLGEIYLYKVGIELFSDISDDVGLSNLTCSFNQKNLVLGRFQMVFDVLAYFLYSMALTLFR